MTGSQIKQIDVIWTVPQTPIYYVCVFAYVFVCRESRSVYRAGASVHRGLIELLPHGESDVGGAHCGGGFNGQLLSVL